MLATTWYTFVQNDVRAHIVCSRTSERRGERLQTTTVETAPANLSFASVASRLARHSTKRYNRPANKQRIVGILYDEAAERASSESRTV